MQVYVRVWVWVCRALVRVCEGAPCGYMCGCAMWVYVWVLVWVHHALVHAREGVPCGCPCRCVCAVWVSVCVGYWRYSSGSM